MLQNLISLMPMLHSMLCAHYAHILLQKVELIELFNVFKIAPVIRKSVILFGTKLAQKYYSSHHNNAFMLWAYYDSTNCNETRQLHLPAGH